MTHCFSFWCLFFYYSGTRIIVADVRFSMLISCIADADIVLSMYLICHSVGMMKNANSTSDFATEF